MLVGKGIFQGTWASRVRVDRGEDLRPLVRTILLAIGEEEMSGKELARRAGYKPGGWWWRELSHLMELGLLIPGRDGRRGYRRGYRRICK